MRAYGRLLLVVLAVVALAVPAGATEEYLPVFNTESVYAHCGADKATANGPATYAFNTTAPAASFTTGAGCGHLDSDKIANDGITFTGKHTGNLDQLTVRAWVIDAGFVRAGAFDKIYVDATLTIDDEPLISQEVQMVPQNSSTGIARLLTFSVTGIGLLDEAEAGEHTVSLDLQTGSYLDGDQLGWVLDATEINSGINFSPATLSGPVVAVEQY